MPSTDELQRRVGELEKQVAALQGARVRAVRKRADWGIGDLPFYDIALGPDLQKGELRGHARGIVAIGDIATGFLALGGWARGIVALGGLATGLFSVGGLSVGVLAAVGGLAIGGVAFGGGAAGTHVISPVRRDPQAEAFFRQYGVEGACHAR